MREEIVKEIHAEIRRLEEIKLDVYEYCYDGEAIWHIEEAVRNLKNAIV